MGEIHTYAYTNGMLSDQGFPVEEVSDFIEGSSATLWIDYTSPTPNDLSILARELDLHELAIEDTMHALQRPKIDYYPDHIFMALHALSLDSDTGQITTSELDVFIKGNCIATVHDGNFNSSNLAKRWHVDSTDISVTVNYLLYHILDVVIDDYLSLVTVFDDYYDSKSEELFTEEVTDITRQKEWFNMRRSLVQYHRVIISTREMITVLLRRENKSIEEEMIPYFHDLYDHIIRISESTDILRELVATIVDTNLNLRDFRQNQIVKQVTSWAAILAVPTLVTGYYGMNVPFPGSNSTWGVATSGGLIVGASLFLYWLFRKQDWI